MNKLFAVWDYDQFPYILGDEVKELLQGGYISTKSYGAMTFKYKKLYPLKEGKKKYAEILRISAVYAEQSKTLHDMAKQCVNDII